MSFNFNNEQSVKVTAKYDYTANIIAYDPVNQIATLDIPVDISLGTNADLGDMTSQYSLSGTDVNLSVAIQKGNSIPVLSTDEHGNLSGIFNIPNGTFQTGQRVFLVDNRINMEDPTSATTYASATFTASGLSTKSQKLEFGASIDSAAGTFTQVNQQSGQLINTRTTVNPYDPIAQSFLVSKDQYPNGIFISSIKVFFEKIPTNNTPITLSVLGTLNGYPDGHILDHSSVIKFPHECKVSSKPHYLDATTYTEFVFDVPVYIQAGTLYAFMLQSTSQDYWVYYGQQNSIALPSTAKALPTDPNPTNPTKIGAAPYIGALFESQNAITWTADQTKNLMFIINQCIFNTTSAQLQFALPKGLPHRKLGPNDIQHVLDANCVSNLFTNTNVSDIPMDYFNLTTSDLLCTGTNIGYSYIATLSSTHAQTAETPISPGRYGSPNPDHVYLNDGQGERVLLTSVDNSFIVNAGLTTTDNNVTPVISDDALTLYSIRYFINDMGIQNNVISVTSTGSGYNASHTSVTVSNPDIGSDVALVSANVTNGKVVSLMVNYPGSGYLTSPKITITDANTTPGTGATAVASCEDKQHGGNAYCRYFTKKVVLAPGNESGDLRVYCTAYRPVGTGIYVYYKILSSNDTQQFDDGSWQLMTMLSNSNTYSGSRDNVIEYEFAPGIFSSNQANNNISYVSTNGNTYNRFIQFAIKIVLSSKDKTQVPHITSLQSLALPPGTNI